MNELALIMLCALMSKQLLIFDEILPQNNCITPIDYPFLINGYYEYRKNRTHFYAWHEQKWNCIKAGRIAE